MIGTAVMPTVEAYDSAFESERRQDYSVITALEQRFGYALDCEKLEAAARVLACPLKAHAPNWQHGRVLYAVARSVLGDWTHRARLLDVGTAKGFSALCLQWALTASGQDGQVFSVDVLDPEARVRRNTVAEVSGFLTLRETLAPWPESQAIVFQQCTGIAWLKANIQRVHVAFVDGKHQGEVVRQEATLLADRQESGDVVVFDDVQILGVSQAVRAMKGVYELEYVDVLPERRYAIGRRR